MRACVHGGRGSVPVWALVWALVWETKCLRVRGLARQRSARLPLLEAGVVDVYDCTTVRLFYYNDYTTLQYDDTTILLFYNSAIINTTIRLEIFYCFKPERSTSMTIRQYYYIPILLHYNKTGDLPLYYYTPIRPYDWRPATASVRSGPRPADVRRRTVRRAGSARGCRPRFVAG